MQYSIIIFNILNKRKGKQKLQARSSGICKGQATKKKFNYYAFSSRSREGVASWIHFFEFETLAAAVPPAAQFQFSFRSKFLRFLMKVLIQSYTFYLLL